MAERSPLGTRGKYCTGLELAFLLLAEQRLGRFKAVLLKYCSLDRGGKRQSTYSPSIQATLAIAEIPCSTRLNPRVYFNGRISVFQTGGVGSIPATRSKAPLSTCRKWGFCQFQQTYAGSVMYVPAIKFESTFINMALVDKTYFLG